MHSKFLNILLFIALWFSCNIIGALLGATTIYFIDPQASAITYVEYIQLAQTADVSSPYLQIFLFIMHSFSFGVPALIYAYFRWSDRFLQELKLTTVPSIKNIIYGLVLLIGILPLSLYFNDLLQAMDWPEWVPHGDREVTALMEEIFQTKTPLTFTLNIMLLGVAAAVGEELLFRGLIQQLFEKVLKNGHYAVLITAIIFGISHFQIEGLVVRILLGAVLGYIFYFTANLWGSIILHFLYNSTQVVLIYTLPGNVVENMTNENYYSIGLLSALFFLIPGIIGFKYLYKNRIYG